MRRQQNIYPAVDPVYTPPSGPIPLMVAPAVMPGGYEQTPGTQVGLPVVTANLGDVQQGVPVLSGVVNVRGSA